MNLKFMGKLAKQREEPFKYHEEVEMVIESLTNLGKGIGRVNGWVVMVPYVIPGERVRARIYRNYGNYSDADLVEVIERAEGRVEARCPLYGVCGGCQYQHMGYGLQLEWKRRHVEEVMQRIGGIEGVVVNSVIGSPREYYYRSKLTPHYAGRGKGEMPVGFLKEGSRHAIVDVAECVIATEGINKALPGLRAEIKEKELKGELKRGGTLLFRDTADGVVMDPRKIVRECVGGMDFYFVAGEFFQNNGFILESLVGFVRENLVKHGVEYVVDAYCGVGLFGLSVSTGVKEAIGVEINEAAVELAKKNKEVNKVENCRFVLGNAEAVFGEIGFKGEKAGVVIDPPRKGCDEEFLKQLVEFGPKVIVYVACDPATQARDVKYLMKAGYQVESIQAFDLFPQTRHIENVVVLNNR